MGKVADLGLTYDEIDRLVTDNPSMYSFLLGYAAELKFRDAVLPGVIGGAPTRKPDDHDRTDPGDRVFDWDGAPVRVEVKSLQTASVRVGADGVRRASAQVDASDRRALRLPNGSTVETTLLAAGTFDILAVNMWALFGQCSGNY